MEKGKDTVLIVMAAGEASRMGRPKQILPVNGVPLIDYQLPRWQKLFTPPPVIVTGAHAREVRAASRAQLVRWVHHPGWEAGLGSSIATAVGYVRDAFPSAGACLLVLLDQVFVGPAHLMRLLEAGSENPESIIASSFDQSAGPPVLFPRKFWPDLLDLDPRKGAAVLFRMYPDQLFRVPVPSAAFDLDTPADYDLFRRLLNGSGPD